MVLSGLVFAAYTLGERMNEDQMLGCLLVWALLATWALALFWNASRPYFRLREKIPALKIPCRISVVALILAVIQVPLWVLMTGQFPPDNFSGFQGVVMVAGVLLGGAGPGAPGILIFIRSLKAANRERHRRIQEDEPK